MANRNRTAGHNYERQIVNEVKDLGYDVVTARSESRNADNAGIDIIGNFPFYIQCKVYKGYPKLNELINNDRPERFQDKPIIVFHKKVKKANTKFIKEDEFVSMRKEDFMNIMSDMDDMQEYIESVRESLEKEDPSIKAKALKKYENKTKNSKSRN